MDNDTQELKGWRAFKFRFGASIDASDKIDTFITDLFPRTDSIGSGCYHTIVDEEELDAQ